MFQPEIFREKRTEKLHEMIDRFPFASVVTTRDGQIEANHIPLVLDPGNGSLGVLHGHLAAANPLCRANVEAIDALALFHGPSSYVSPSWYASKAIDGKVVPTWNYLVVHARGKLSFHRDAEWKLGHLHTLTDRQETNRKIPWSVSDAPADFIERQLRGIVGIEISVESLDGVVKVSQNKNPVDREGVVSGIASERQSLSSQQSNWMSEILSALPGRPTG